MRPINIVIVGARGAVGAALLEVLQQRAFPVGELRIGGHQGGQVEFAGRTIPVQPVSRELFSGCDVAFMAAAADVSRTWAPVAVEEGCLVIDKSNAFRMDPQVPLVVPEVNPDRIPRGPALVASPNCSTIQLVVALKPLEDAFGIREVQVATYQAVSGSGREAMEELEAGTRQLLLGEPEASSVYPKPIAMNVLALCDRLDDDGYTLEERKLTRETRRILERADLPLSATAVRVPVMVGHSEAVFCRLARPASVADALAVWERAPGIVLRTADVPTPREAAGQDEVLVGRVRQEEGRPDGLLFWVVADNLRKGAATNAVQTAEAALR